MFSSLVKFLINIFFSQSKPKIETKPEKESTPKPDKKQEKENVAPSSPPATPVKPAPPPERRPADKKDNKSVYFHTDQLTFLASYICADVGAEWMRYIELPVTKD